MVKRRVIINYFNNEAKLKVQERIENAKVTSSFIVGDIDEEDIPVLEKEKGLIIEVTSSKNPVITPGKINGAFLKDIDNTSFTERAFVIDQNKPNFYVIELDGPLLKEWKEKINDLEIKLISSIPYYNYLAKLTPDQTNKIKSLEFVKNVSLYDKSDKRIVEASTTVHPSTNGLGLSEEKIKCFAILHDENDLEKTLNWFRTNDIEVNSSDDKIISFTIKNNSSLLESIRQLPEVSEVEKDIPHEEYNDISRILLNIDHNSGNGLPSTSFSEGEGQIIGVIDSGIDKEHPDFQGRIIAAIREVIQPRPNDTSDYSGHGTHVAGSILGDGTASDKKIRGVAPKAKLFFQSVGGEGRSVIIPSGEKEFFEFCNRAYNAGVRISNNSWGANVGSIYYFSARRYDKYALEHPDMLFVVAAGNNGEAIYRKNGQSYDPLYSKKGYVDWYSLGSPGTFKNGLTVGATRSSRADGPNKDATWGQRTKQDLAGQSYYPFPDPPISNERVCGDPESMAAFSSRGPVEPRRIKPDVVSPGTDILSTRSSLDPNNNFGNAKYIFKSGTSMATPLVSGCVALVREYYVKKRNHNPSAALLKATIINGTKWLGGQDAIADHDKTPNFHQGFGFVNMNQTIPNKANPDLILEFVDTWIYDDRNRKIKETGSQKKYHLKVSNGKHLRVCMTYIDRPGVGLENNINLFLYHKETNNVFRGNQQIRTDINIPDPDNNVEVIRLENPSDGNYEVSVAGRNLLDEPLDFVLVVTGDNISSLSEIE